MIVDFHSHTCKSDGTLTPQNLQNQMTRYGVSIYAITDHDTLAAHVELDAEEAGVTPSSERPQRITGIEINTSYNDNEVHILGYGFPAQGSSLGALIASNRDSRLLRIEEMAAKLTAAGYAITFGDILAEAQGAEALGRPHVAKALIRHGYTNSVDTAIREFLRKGRPGYVVSKSASAFDAIAAIHAAGGVAVLAHPCRLDDYGLIEVMARAGIDGLEVFYPRHTPALVSYFRSEAKRLGLLITAGSDFHDARYHSQNVGMEVDQEDLRPFFEAIGIESPESMHGSR